MPVETRSDRQAFLREAEQLARVVTGDDFPALRHGVRRAKQLRLAVKKARGRVGSRERERLQAFAEMLEHAARARRAADRIAELGPAEETVEALRAFGFNLEE